jgi:hypothetical protein
MHTYIHTYTSRTPARFDDIISTEEHVPTDTTRERRRRHRVEPVESDHNYTRASKSPAVTPHEYDTSLATGKKPRDYGDVTNFDSPYGDSPSVRNRSEPELLDARSREEYYEDFRDYEVRSGRAGFAGADMRARQIRMALSAGESPIGHGYVSAGAAAVRGRAPDRDDLEALRSRRARG